jgi:cation diffusion facilitator CzcD-associated flavoprotein CzcO
MNAPSQTAQPHKADLDVAIIGAGFSGICMAIALKKAGYTAFRIFEKAHDLGGTWRDNQYPGCACDVPSHLYSFSFEQNPNWSRSFSPQPEIWRYMKDCASKYAILPHMQFDAAIAAAQYDEADQIWRLKLKSGQSVSARAVVSGVGALHLPAYPQISGLDTFAGRTFHSSAWDQNFDLRGKTIGVIGTGASAIQIVPSIAPEVKQLYLFQRTPSWIVPRMDRAFSQNAQRRFRRIPFLQRLFRNLIYWRMEFGVLGFLGNRGFMKQVEKFARAYIDRSIPDEKLRAALTPNYAIGCKRILISDDFYASLTRDNVELVTAPISEATSDTIMTNDGAARKIDALIYATGFRATDLLSEISIVGRGGRHLSDDWRTAPKPITASQRRATRTSSCCSAPIRGSATTRSSS